MKHWKKLAIAEGALLAVLLLTGSTTGWWTQEQREINSPAKVAFLVKKYNLKTQLFELMPIRPMRVMVEATDDTRKGELWNTQGGAISCKVYKTVHAATFADSTAAPMTVYQTFMRCGDETYKIKGYVYEVEQ